MRFVPHRILRPLFAIGTASAVGRASLALPEKPFAIGRAASVLPETPFAIGRAVSLLKYAIRVWMWITA
jgi:hypothetical protein